MVVVILKLFCFYINYIDCNFFIIFEASKIQLWPILCSIVEIPRAEPLVVGVFCAERKPQTSNILRQFVDELNYVIRNGLEINGHKLNVRINCFICDSPARALLKSMFSEYKKITYADKIDTRKIIKFV